MDPFAEIGLRLQYLGGDPRDPAPDGARDLVAIVVVAEHLAVCDVDGFVPVPSHEENCRLPDLPLVRHRRILSHTRTKHPSSRLVPHLPARAPGRGATSRLLVNPAASRL